MTNQIVVNGSTPRKRALAREIVKYCIKELMPRTTTLDISVNICKIEDLYEFALDKPLMN